MSDDILLVANILTAVDTPPSSALPKILKLALTWTPSTSMTAFLMTAYMHLSKGIYECVNMKSKLKEKYYVTVKSFK